jgi:hypothetical protein
MLGGFQLLDSGVLCPFADILTFDPGATIDQNAKTINLVVPYGTDLKILRARHDPVLSRPAQGFGLRVEAACVIEIRDGWRLQGGQSRISLATPVSMTNDMVRMLQQ